MHIITQKRIWEAKEQFPDAASALNGWFRVMNKNQFNSFSDLKKSFKSVDKVGCLYVFDVGGNKLRLIASIHFNKKRVYIRYILNHSDYDKGFWKT